jgi:hypothetical protein
MLGTNKLASHYFAWERSVGHVPSNGCCRLFRSHHSIRHNEVRRAYVEQYITDDGSAAAFPTFLIVGLVVAAVIHGAQ